VVRLHVRGAVGAWDRKKSLVPGHHPKYRRMLEQVITPADNIIVLHVDMTETSMQFRRSLRRPT
jgi:hypothetical protein